MRPPGQVGDAGGARIEPQIAVQGGVHLLEMNRPVFGLLGVLGGRADDLAGLYAAAGLKGAADLRPVVPAAFLVDLRCPAGFGSPRPYQSRTRDGSRSRSMASASLLEVEDAQRLPQRLVGTGQAAAGVQVAGNGIL